MLPLHGVELLVMSSKKGRVLVDSRFHASVLNPKSPSIELALEGSKECSFSKVLGKHVFAKGLLVFDDKGFAMI